MGDAWGRLSVQLDCNCTLPPPEGNIVRLYNNQMCVASLNMASMQ